MFVQLQDVKKMEQAVTFVGKAVFLPNELMPKLDDDEFYYKEIIGFKLIDAVKGDIIVVTYTAAASGGWEAIGKDNDDLSKELNPDTEKSKNVLGEATFTHKGYEPEISVDPYFIDPSRKMYKRISENARKEKFAENDLVGYFAEAYFDTANPATGKMTGTCIVRKAWYVPQSTGGDTSGYAVPVTITPFGPSEEKVITYDMATNEATISDPS